MSRYIVQFFVLSTGYVHGTIPPQYCESHKKPTPACGSNSMIRFDGRYNLQTTHEKAKAYAKKQVIIGGFIGYQIMHYYGADYNSFLMQKPACGYVSTI
jgi:ribosomal protein S19